MTTHDILSRLEGVRGGHGQWTARCPAHDDRQNSLSVSEGKDGRVLLHCHAGCDLDAITGALGLAAKDLFAGNDGGALGWNDTIPAKKRGRAPVIATYDYKDDSGKLLAQKLRRADKSFSWRRPDGRHGWIYDRKGVPNRLYVGGELAGAVFVCEGEKDVDTLHGLGHNAASGADGAGPGKWKPEYTEQLRGCSVCVFTDNDDVGRAYAAETCNALHGVASSVRLLDLSAVWPEIPEHGDITDLVVKFGGPRARELIGQLVVSTPEWEPCEVPQVKEDKPPILMPMSGVEAREPSYLISPYLPEGMLAIMGGVSGSGKTYLVLSWAAAVSNGQRLPFQRQTDPAPPAGYVYYFTQENDPNTIIRPRLDLLGANLDRILIQASTGGTYEPLTMNDPRLEEAAKQYPPALVIFDPIQSYLGGGVDMSRAEQVRPTLDWLGDYAKRHKCSVVLVSHMSKPTKGEYSALDRLLGSSDFRNAARSIVIVGRDPSDKETRVFAHGKNSIGEPGPSQKYHISGRGITYDGPSDLTADDIIKQSAEQTRNKPAATLTATMDKLEELLGDEGWATLEQVETWQTLEGIAKSTLYNARKELALQTVSIGKPPHRTTWWLRSDVDVNWFKSIHTPAQEPTEQPELSQ